MIKLKTFKELKNFKRKSDLFFIETINGADEEKKLHSELELAEMPWNVLQEHIEFFNNRLSALFNQLLQIFAKCKG